MRLAEEAEATFQAIVVEIRQAGAHALPALPVDIRVSGDLTDIRISATQSGKISFAVSVSERHLTVHLPQDDGSIRYGATTTDLTDLRIIHHRGIVEIFANGGAVAGTDAATRMSPPTLFPSKPRPPPTFSSWQRKRPH